MSRDTAKTTRFIYILTFLIIKMSLLEIKSATITAKGQISIPKEIRTVEGFKVGSKIAILAYQDHVELRPMGQINKRIDTAFASQKVLAKDWDSKEDEEAWKNL